VLAWPRAVCLVELDLEGVRQLFPDEVAEAGPRLLGQDHAQVGVAGFLAFGDDLVQGAPQGLQAPAAVYADVAGISANTGGGGDDQGTRLVPFLTEVDRQRRA
jgi:hypothetical protein